MSFRFTGKHIHVARAPMASGSGGGGDGPPKQPHIVDIGKPTPPNWFQRLVAWIKKKLGK